MPGHLDGESTTQSKNVRRRIAGNCPGCGSTSHSKSTHRLCPHNARNQETQLPTVTHAVQDASLLHIEDQHIAFVLLIQVKMQLKDAAQHRMEEGIMICAKQRPLLKTPNMVHGIEKLH
ncbi:hypothetical protein BC941DRAFT_468378 [Chlamydoabsidia padenii]|nr:hypothetical protein BC941DRAFT_468378 [Chlamydoabsidia padenii]